MIVCSCNLITHYEIESAVDRLREEGPHRLLTPLLVYKALGRRPQCSNCMKLAAKLIYARLACPGAGADASPEGAGASPSADGGEDGEGPLEACG